MDGQTPIYRAPMRARDRDIDPYAGARSGVACGLVGIGAARPEQLKRFAELPEATFVWTRTGERSYRLGRIAGPCRYDDSPDARETGIHHVRDAHWLDEEIGNGEVPAAVLATFARGGRNLQRTHDEDAER